MSQLKTHSPPPFLAEPRRSVNKLVRACAAVLSALLGIKRGFESGRSVSSEAPQPSAWVAPEQDAFRSVSASDLRLRYAHQTVELPAGQGLDHPAGVGARFLGGSGIRLGDGRLGVEWDDLAPRGAVCSFEMTDLQGTYAIHFRKASPALSVSDLPASKGPLASVAGAQAMASKLFALEVRVLEDYLRVPWQKDSPRDMIERFRGILAARALLTPVHEAALGRVTTAFLSLQTA